MTDASRHMVSRDPRTKVHELVSWSLTSLFSTNMAVSETNKVHEIQEISVNWPDL